METGALKTCLGCSGCGLAGQTTQQMLLSVFNTERVLRLSLRRHVRSVRESWQAPLLQRSVERPNEQEEEILQIFAQSAY